MLYVVETLKNIKEDDLYFLCITSLAFIHKNSPLFIQIWYLFVHVQHLATYKLGNYIF